MDSFEMILPFLKPIEHLILDDSISEVMVNGPEHVFIERQGCVEEIPGFTSKSLDIAVWSIAWGSRVAAVVPPAVLGLSSQSASLQNTLGSRTSSVSEL